MNTISNLKQISENVFSFENESFSPFQDHLMIGNVIQMYLDERELSICSTKFPLDALIAALPPQIKSQENFNILELGCSNARNIRLLIKVIQENVSSKINFGVYGIDIVKEFLIEAERRFNEFEREYNINAKEFHILDWSKHELQFMNKKFDIILSSKFLYNVKTKLSKKKFIELRKYLKKDGCFFLEAYVERNWKAHAFSICKKILGINYANGNIVDLYQVKKWAKSIGLNLFYFSKKQGKWTHHLKNLTTYQLIWKNK